MPFSQQLVRYMLVPLFASSVLMLVVYFIARERIRGREFWLTLLVVYLAATRCYMAPFWYFDSFSPPIDPERSYGAPLQAFDMSGQVVFGIVGACVSQFLMVFGLGFLIWVQTRFGFEYRAYGFMEKFSLMAAHFFPAATPKGSWVWRAGAMCFLRHTCLSATRAVWRFFSLSWCTRH